MPPAPPSQQTTAGDEDSVISVLPQQHQDHTTTDESSNPSSSNDSSSSSSSSSSISSPSGSSSHEDSTSSSSGSSSSEHSSRVISSDSSSDSRPIPSVSVSVDAVPGGFPEFNQNYDEQSDASYPAYGLVPSATEDGGADTDADDDDDGLFDDDEDPDEKAKRLAIAAAAALQNDRGHDDDDDYDDYDDYEEPAKVRSPSAADDSFRSDDSSQSSAVGASSSAFSSRSRGKTGTKLGSNDAIKFIDTPHGKAGFVYQAPAAAAPTDPKSPKLSAGGDSSSSDGDVFDEDEEDLAYARRKSAQAASALASAGAGEAPKQRITPVLTADGKVALLYRGAADSGSTGKYEPIKNFTNYEEPAGTEAPLTSTTTVFEYTTVLQTSSSSSTSSTTEVASVTTTSSVRTTTIVAGVGGQQPQPVPGNTEENAILPNINRPLSEVLGIKKNQFTQFRITEHGQPGVPPPPPQLQPQPPVAGSAGTAFRPHHHQHHQHHHHESSSNRLPDDAMMRSDSDDRDAQGRGQIQQPPPLRSAYDGVAGADEGTDADEDLDPNYTDALGKTEVVNLAIIPAFDSDLLAIQEQEDLRAAAEAEAEFGQNYVPVGDSSGGEYNDVRQHYRTPGIRRTPEDLSAIHCAMQVMVAVAALVTVFGMLGAYIRTRVFGRVQLVNWWNTVGMQYWVGLRRGGVVL